MPEQPSASPFLVKDINAVGAASSPSSLTVFDGALYLFADDGIHGSELFRLDALGNTTLVKDLLPGALGSGGKLLTKVGNTPLGSPISTPMEMPTPPT
jgi:ELWxxDGT repeat protein